MGKINLLHDESYRAARLVVRHFEQRLSDEELRDALFAVQAMISDGMLRLLEQVRREHRQLHPLSASATEHIANEATT